MMFVLFVIGLPLAISEAAAAGRDAGGPVVCMGLFLLGGGGVFSVFFLPFHWDTIMRLSAPFKVLGLIGGFGLIAILGLMLIRMLPGIVGPFT
ncbi:MAG TPA: hypothetical protein VM389_01900 [Phycisphaerae bacterium]|nr:hypothetical protein [Phycisphaerae bacterium]